MNNILTNLNPYITNTGDYKLLNGVIANDNSILSELYFVLNTPLGGYIYDKNLGNQLLNLPYVPKKEAITQNVTNALQRLITNGRITNVIIDVTLYIAQAGAYSVLITCNDNVGNPLKFNWNRTINNRRF